MMSDGEIQEFLSKHRLLASQYDPQEIIAAFLSEKKKGWQERAEVMP